jgi:mannose-6-phosphate isomerase
MLYPFTFHPVLMERVWGGRNLADRYRKQSPGTRPIGESWELTDRDEAVSVIAEGPLAGRDLRWLMMAHGTEILGRAGANGMRFPVLMKILDAEEKLSLQVHPPTAVASRFGGEPKSELWYVAHATPEAALYVGLRSGVSRLEFERRVRDGTVADCFHRIPVRPGDAMFLPSGRVHALGAGNVIFEIQQNSDTTYRVFDWNRVGFDGQPRELHVEQALACIDFDDVEPSLIQAAWLDEGAVQRRALIDDPLFEIHAFRSNSSGHLGVSEQRCRIISVVQGALSIDGGGHSVSLDAGGLCLLPACLRHVQLRWAGPVEFLSTRVGTGSCACP